MVDAAVIETLFMGGLMAVAAFCRETDEGESLFARVWFFPKMAFLAGRFLMTALKLEDGLPVIKGGRVE